MLEHYLWAHKNTEGIGISKKIEEGGQHWMASRMTVFGYVHTTLDTRDPIPHSQEKKCTAGIVLRWETTREAPVTYLFLSSFILFASMMSLKLCVLPNGQ